MAQEKYRSKQVKSGKAPKYSAIRSKGPVGTSRASHMVRTQKIKKKKKVARPEDVFIIGPDGKRKRKPVGDPRLRASDVFIIGPDGKRKRKPAVPKKNTKKRKT